MHDTLERPTAEPRAPRSHRWLRRVLVAVAVVAAVALAGGIWLWMQWQSRGPDEASTSDALSRFRETTVAESPVVTLRPPAGVYTYAGEGSESLSFLDTEQPQGPTIPGTVTHGADGCWTFRVEYNSFHAQAWNWCARDGKLYESGGTTTQKFDFVAFTVDERSVFVCDPELVAVDLAATATKSTPAECTGDSETTGSHVVSAGTTTFVGRERLRIGAETVTAVHYRSDRELSGGQHGTERVDMWFSAETGLPLRNERTIEVASPAPDPLGDITYTETGSFELTSLEPLT